MRENFKRASVAPAAVSSSTRRNCRLNLWVSPTAHIPLLSLSSVFTFVALRTNWIYVRSFPTKVSPVQSGTETEEPWGVYVYGRTWRWLRSLWGNCDTCARLKSVLAVIFHLLFSIFISSFYCSFYGFPIPTKEILKQFARLMPGHVKFFNCLQIGSREKRKTGFKRNTSYKIPFSIGFWTTEKIFNLT